MFLFIEMIILLIERCLGIFYYLIIIFNILLLNYYFVFNKTWQVNIIKKIENFSVIFEKLQDYFTFTIESAQINKTINNNFKVNTQFENLANEILESNEQNKISQDTVEQITKLNSLNLPKTSKQRSKKDLKNNLNNVSKLVNNVSLLSTQLNEIKNLGNDLLNLKNDSNK
jgi:hypothetical protein